MKTIHVPRISANEDEINVVEIYVNNNTFYNKGDLLCLLESTKASVEIDSEDDGYVLFVVVSGDVVSTGQVIAYLNDSPINHDQLPKIENGTKELKVTKKAQQLLDKYHLLPEDIKSFGIIKAVDVESYKTTGDDDICSDYEQLEKIMKNTSSEVATFDDIKKLKATMQMVGDIYSKKWNRQIPSLDILFDRWTNGERAGFGEDTNISHLTYVFGDISVGKKTYIGPYSYLDGTGELTIGDFCSIAAGVQIYTHNTISRTLSGHKKEKFLSQTKIGNCCFIGPQSVITAGVTIGDHCLISANSLVTTDLPSFSVVQGSPCKVIGRVKLEKDGVVKIEIIK